MSWDFFVSSAEADRPWAEWIASHLEQTGRRVRAEVRDRAPGHNRVHRLDEAIRLSRRMIVLLSPSYLADDRLAAEWHATWEADPGGLRRALVPVRVAECRAEGLLRDVRCVDLVGLSEEEARTSLTTAIDGYHPRAPRRPLFPR